MDHIDRVVEHWQDCLLKGKAWDDTFPLRSKNGEYRWFLSRAQPIRDDNGKILRWFGTNTDVTKTKQAEDALRAKEEQMRLGIEVAEFAIAQIDYVTDTIHLSREAARLDGYHTATMLRQMGFAKPIVALTADAMHGDMNRCLESGCDDYLSKPIDSNALLEMVWRHTRHKSEKR